MLKSSLPKRTGIYRLGGNINELQLRINLRHLCEWLPVPKFEYPGATFINPNPYPFADDTLSLECFIYLPHEDESGQNYFSYYTYYTPSNSSAVSRNASLTNSSSTIMSQLSQLSLSQQSEQSLTLEPPAEDAFSTWNRELCNGATADMCIGWQQKHFSVAELQHYADASKCHTQLQRRYHRWTQYILQLQYQHEQRVREEARRLLMQMRLRKSRRSKESIQKSITPPSDEDPNFTQRTCLIYTLVNADLELMADAQLPAGALELLEEGCQLMYVYAQLQRETLLLSLCYRPTEGVLYVYPDFNGSAEDMDYVVEIDNDCRQLYSYGIENLTPLHPVEKITMIKPPPPVVPTILTMPPDSATSLEVLEHLKQQRLENAEMRRIMNFAAPPKRMRRVTLLMELHEAQHFEYPNVHVRYYMQPPRNTQLEPVNPNDGFPLRGATSTCVAGGAAQVALLGHCWQLTLLCDEELLQLHHQMHIYFEVISVDSWQRERCEGYAHFACSLLAPLPKRVIQGLQLQCSRPKGNWLDALNRYFIGGRALFDFVNYFNPRQFRDDLLHTRLDEDRTQAMATTGTLVFSMRKVTQRQTEFGYRLKSDVSDVHDDYEDESYMKMKSREGMTKTLEEVLAAFTTARERIEVMLANPAIKKTN